MGLAPLAAELIQLAESQPGKRQEGREIQRFIEYLTNLKIKNKRVTTTTVLNYIATRMTNTNGKLKTLDSVKLIISRVKKYLKSRGYTTDNPASSSRVDDFIKGYKVKLVTCRKVRKHTPPVDPALVFSAISWFYELV